MRENTVEKDPRTVTQSARAHSTERIRDSLKSYLEKSNTTRPERERERIELEIAPGLHLAVR